MSACVFLLTLVAAFGVGFADSLGEWFTGVVFFATLIFGSYALAMGVSS